jgi:hypothetical protein
MRSNHKTRLALFFATSTTLLLLGGCSNSVDYYKAHEKEARTKVQECDDEEIRNFVTGKKYSKNAECENAGEVVKQLDVVAFERNTVWTAAEAERKASIETELEAERKALDEGRVTARSRHAAEVEETCTAASQPTAAAPISPDELINARCPGSDAGPNSGNPPRDPARWEAYLACSNNLTAQINSISAGYKAWRPTKMAADWAKKQCVADKMKSFDVEFNVEFSIKKKELGAKYIANGLDFYF